MRGRCVYCGRDSELDEGVFVELHSYGGGRCPGALLPPRRDEAPRRVAHPDPDNVGYQRQEKLVVSRATRDVLASHPNVDESKLDDVVDVIPCPCCGGTGVENLVFDVASSKGRRAIRSGAPS